MSLALAAMLSLATLSQAGTPPASTVVEQETVQQDSRSWGIGSNVAAGGAGVGVLAGGGGVTAYGAGFVPMLMLPTVDLHFFVQGGNTVELSVPLLNLVLVNAVSLANQGGVAIFGAEAFYCFRNELNPNWELVYGPGLYLGGLVGAVSGLVTRPGATVGVEYRAGNIGVRGAFKPFVEVDYLTDGSVSAGAVGAGGTLTLGVMYYPGA